MQVLLHNGSIEQSKLLEQLSILGLDKGTENSRFGGDAVKVLDNLCSQMYLERTNDTAEGEPIPTYFLGLRARKEITKERIVAFLEDCNGEPLPASFRFAANSAFCNRLQSCLQKDSQLPIMCRKDLLRSNGDDEGEDA